jgi:flagellar export protein FliJ
MSALEQLVRLHGWTLDERRRKAADLEQLADRLKADLSRIDGELEREAKTAAESPELRAAFTAYSAIARRRRDKLARSVADVETEIERAREEVAEAFQELKRYEQALANRKARAAGVVRRREQTAADEVGIEMFRRKSEAGGTGG